jgi:hypothetical protein
MERVVPAGEDLDAALLALRCFASAVGQDQVLCGVAIQRVLDAIKARGGPDRGAVAIDALVALHERGLVAFDGFHQRDVTWEECQFIRLTGQSG